jgi:hypothetical protein
VCAWCKKVLVPGNPEHGISHGICSPCSSTLWQAVA